MKYHLVSTLLMAAAFPLYVAGFAIGGSAALAIGGLLEAWFWIRVVRARSP